jgi:hypothetical protein
MPIPLDLHFAKFLSRGFLSTYRDRRSRLFPRSLLFASLPLCAICTACGAVGSGPAAPAPVTVTVTPSSAQPYQGDKVPFSVTVENASSSAVNWQVNGTAGGNPMVGTIDSTGMYVAPALVPNPPTVMVTAVLQSDSTKTGFSSVTVLSLSSYTGPLIVSPALSSVTPSQTLQMQVSPPSFSKDVSWAVDGGGITSGGLYTPPSTPGAYTVIASLPHATGSATVEVTDFPGTPTWRNDNARTGINSWERALAPSKVSPSTFGKLFSCSIDGYAYAQPLYVPNLAISGKGTRNVVLVATEKDSVFAFDADTNTSPCVPLWQTSLVPHGLQAISNANSDITPFVGITGTPVIDMSRTTPYLYVIAATQTVELNPTYTHWLFALDLSAVPPEIQPPGAGVGISSPDTLFNSLFENQRAALLLNDGTVYIAFGSYGGLGDYHGWLFGYDSSTLERTGGFNVTQPPAIQGGIWQSGGGPSADSNGNVFVATGDGPFNADRTLGSLSYGDSFLRFTQFTIGTSPLVADYFTPCDQAALQTDGLDVGASAPVLVKNSNSQPDLLIGGSKGGALYVVNPHNMGGFNSDCSQDSLPRVQTVSVGAGATILSTPLFWNNSVYVAPGNGNLMSFPMMSGGMLNPSPSPIHSQEIFGPQGATPVISWNASSNETSSAILWLIDSSGATTNAPAILRAFDPNNLSNEIYHSTTTAGSRDTAGPAVKFTVPTVANGKVYVGTQTELDVYGLLP